MFYAIRPAAFITPTVSTADANENQLDSYDYGTSLIYGSNIAAAWTYATGTDVNVALIDDGFTASTVNNFSAESQSFGVAGTGEPSGGYHGTTTSGLIGGSGLAGAPVGVAPNATIIGLKVDMGSAPFSEFTNAMNAAAATADVVNNSWGFSGYGAGAPATVPAWNTAVQAAVSTGRGGLGTIVVFAAGNDAADANNLGVQPVADDPRAIAVAASQTNGTVAPFSNPGSGLLVAADGVNVDVALPSGATELASGTSYAAPTVSAITAMMLQVNPNLGWRDVQEILADSAYAPPPSAASFTTNGATDWNGGGMQFSDQLGFGIVDADVAVNLARAWTGQSTSANLDTQTVTQSTAFGVSINGTGISTLVDPTSERIQHVQVTLTDTGVLAADTQLVLVSPDGTRSVLVDDTGLVNGTDQTGGLDLSGNAITSNAFWGENGAGTWTLQVQDSNGSSVGTVQNWTLTVDGDAAAGSAPLVYTPQFAVLAAAAPGRDVVTPDGATTIDLIGLNHATELNLNGGKGMIDGVGVTVQPGLLDANADGCTGQVVITTAAAGSQITGGDGDTAIYGGGGDDTVTAGLGPTCLWSQNDTKMTFLAGSGTSAVHGGSGETDITAGTGASQLVLTAGSSGGLDVISGFQAGLDTVHLVGYGAGAGAAAVAAETSDGHAGTLLSLADGTRIDFSGIGHVSQSVFA
jgi:subtilisin-like proprotein convertase family protein